MRAILTNARYTGHEVWGTFAKAEELIDPEEPTLGYRTRLVRSTQQPVRSREQAHEAIVDVVTWIRASKLLSARSAAAKASPGRQTRSRGVDYALQGLIVCGVCSRRMQVQRTKVHDLANPTHIRYRCRARDLTPGTTLLDHPASASIGQAAVFDRLNPWLLGIFQPGPVREATIGAMITVVDTSHTDIQVERLRERVADAETRLRRFTDALASGVDPVALVGPINAAQADAHAAREEIDALASPAVAPAREQVEAAFEALGADIGDVLSADRSPRLLREFYASLGLALTWHHTDRRLIARLDLASAVSAATYPTEIGGVSLCVRGGT